MMEFRARRRGFTLVELMVVVAIVGILAAIAYPLYTEQVRKTRRSDGKAALLALAQQLERCYTEYNKYNDANCPILTGNPPNALATSMRTSEEGFYTLTLTRLTSTAFTLRANPTGAQSGDVCGSFTYTHTGAKGVVNGTESVDRCW